MREPLRLLAAMRSPVPSRFVRWTAPVRSGQKTWSAVTAHATGYPATVPPSAGSRADAAAVAGGMAPGVNDVVRGFPSSFSTTSRASPRSTMVAGDRTGSSTGPRRTRHAEAPPSGPVGTVEPGVDADGAGGAASGEDGARDAGGAAEAADGADALADGAGGEPVGAGVDPACPGAPLHAVRATKTSHHGARTLLLYYASNARPHLGHGGGTRR